MIQSIRNRFYPANRIISISGQPSRRVFHFRQLAGRIEPVSRRAAVFIRPCRAITESIVGIILMKSERIRFLHQFAPGVICKGIGIAHKVRGQGDLPHSIIFHAP